MDVIESKKFNINIITQDRADIIKEVLAIPYNVMSLVGKGVKGVLVPISDIIYNKDLKSNAQKAADKCDEIIPDLEPHSEIAIFRRDEEFIGVSY